jgi:hypothetical protein
MEHLECRLVWAADLGLPICDLSGVCQPITEGAVVPSAQNVTANGPASSAATKVRIPSQQNDPSSNRLKNKDMAEGEFTPSTSEAEIAISPSDRPSVSPIANRSQTQSVVTTSEITTDLQSTVVQPGVKRLIETLPTIVDSRTDQALDSLRSNDSNPFPPLARQVPVSSDSLRLEERLQSELIELTPTASRGMSPETIQSTDWRLANSSLGQLNRLATNRTATAVNTPAPREQPSLRKVSLALHGLIAVESNLRPVQYSGRITASNRSASLSGSYQWAEVLLDKNGGLSAKEVDMTLASLVPDQPGSWLVRSGSDESSDQLEEPSLAPTSMWESLLVLLTALTVMTRRQRTSSSK